MASSEASSRTEVTDEIFVNVDVLEEMESLRRRGFVWCRSERTEHASSSCGRLALLADLGEASRLIQQCRLDVEG